MANILWLLSPVRTKGTLAMVIRKAIKSGSEKLIFTFSF
jgi:hypothetical protein